MFESVLIANRGEIACRIARTVRRLGMRSIAVYSEADANARHVEMADEAYLIGPAPALHSYLDIGKVLAVAKASGARAIHPGYGFLSENDVFADACENAGVVFVGPSGAAIRTMGSKIEAKRLVSAAGTPVVPGYQGDDQDARVLADAAAEVGYPLLIKASAGGGGKGMRLVNEHDGFARALEGARREAAAAFGDDRVLLERYLAAPKHLEVQIIGDTHGRMLHLFERDCSVQRRHQKVIEEAPGPGVTPDLREQLGEAALTAARAIDYVGAGTVEFIAEGEEFFFMEMNTRLQVEHPVTEAITGLDLVEWQLRVAAGEALELGALSIGGHAIEVRLYAENPVRRFLPSTGQLVRFHIAEGIRLDSGVREGDRVSVHYDPMLAKLIAHGETREDARRSLVNALSRSRVAGVEHNLGYLRALLDHPSFVGGEYTTRVAQDIHDELLTPVTDEDWCLAALAAIRLANSAEEGPWSDIGGWRLNLPPRTRVGLKLGKQRRDVLLSEHDVKVDGGDAIALNVLAACGEAATVDLGVRQFRFGWALHDGRVYLMRDGATLTFELLTDVVNSDVGGLTASGRIEAPMPGEVVNVAVAAGERVSQGQVLVVLEAMKMEHTITAPEGGTVKEVKCVPGQRVQEHAELIVLENRD